MGPTAATAVLVVYDADTGAAKALGGLATLVLLPLVLHHLWRFTIPTYRRWANRSSRIRGEIGDLRQRIATVFTGYRERRKGERFKQAYALTGRSVRALEEALSVGMYRERREVFVTAFMRGGVAVRVTASIGSPFRCAAADDPARWRAHVERLGCDEVRQYHNHPVHTGRTRPSRTDVRTAHALRGILGPHGAKLRSLIICWNGLREWKVFEHAGDGRHWLHFELDAGVHLTSASHHQASPPRAPGRSS
jgi:hypothetical protein